ncbi:MAG: tail-specific protease, partial [Verrucomicrobiota bacterium]|nr:tail-specific protease [Verrucomicrobiota bacterium]
MLSSAASFRRALILIFLAFWTATGAFARAAFSTSDELAAEARGLVHLLEEGHYNRDGIKSSDYVQVISDYMSALDQQHLFFLAGDETVFTNRYRKNLYWNVSQLGNIDAAYEIYDVYQKRTEARINWIFG